MSQHEPDDFTQLRGAFDQPIAPSPRFANRLKEEIGMEAARIATTSPEAPGSHPGAAHGTPTGRVLRMNTWPGALMTAATIALVLALGFAAFRPVIERNGGPDVDNGNGGFVATPSTPENAQPADEETLLGGFVGTDAGYGLGPLRELGDTLEYAETIEGVPGYIPYSGIVGNVGLSAEAGSGPLRAVDMTNGADLWSLDIQVRGQIVSDGSRIYLSFANNGTAEYGLAAYELYTGRRLWYVPDAAAAGFEVYSQGPLVADGVVYMHDDYQTFFAVDAASGDVLWTTTLEHEIQRSIQGDFGQQATLDAPPQMAISGDSLVVMVGQQYLSALNRHDGSLVATTTFRDAFVPGYPYAEFSMLDGVAYVSTYFYSSGNASPAATDTPPEPVDGAITAIQPETGEILWRSEINSLQSVAVSADDRLVAVTAEGIVSLDRAIGTDRIDVPVGFASTNPDVVVRTDGDTAWIAASVQNLLTVVQTDGRSILRTWEMAVDGMSLIDTMTAYNGGLLIHSQYAAAYQIAPLVELSAPEVATPATPVTSTGAPSAWGGADRSFHIDEPLAAGMQQSQIVAPSADQYVVNAQRFGDYLVRATTDSATLSSPALEAVDLRSGTIAWRIGGAFGISGASDGRAVFTWRFNEEFIDALIAIDLHTGATVWIADIPDTTPLEHLPYDPVYADGLVFVPFGDQYLYAFDAGTGNLAWRYEHAPVADRALWLGDLRVNPQNVMIAHSGGTLYVVWEGRVVTALDAATGAEQWSHTVEEMDPERPGVGLIATDGTRVYVSTTEIPDIATPRTETGYLLALDATTGERLWSLDQMYAYSMSVMDGTLFVLTDQNLLQALDTAKGVPRSDWYEVPLQIGPGYVATSPGTVWLQSTDKLYRFDADTLGKLPDSYTIAEPFNAEIPVYSMSVPMAWEGKLLVAALDGSVWVVEESSATPSAEVTPLEVPAGTATYEIVELPLPETPDDDMQRTIPETPEAGATIEGGSGGDPEAMPTDSPPTTVTGPAISTCPTATSEPTPTVEVTAAIPTIGSESTATIVAPGVAATADVSCASPTVEPTATREAAAIEGGDNLLESTATATVDTVIRPVATEG